MLTHALASVYIHFETRLLGDDKTSRIFATVHCSMSTGVFLNPVPHKADFFLDYG